MPYAAIADVLRQKYDVRVCRETIFKFVKVRARGRKAYFFRREVAAKQLEPIQAPRQPTNAGAGAAPKPKFEFTYSERYNLKRLPEDEAAAIRKKLEAEGH